MVVSSTESKSSLVRAPEESEIEGLYRLRCHRCRQDIAINLPDPSRDPSKKREVMIEHKKTCRAEDFEFTMNKQTRSRLE